MGKSQKSSVANPAIPSLPTPPAATPEAYFSDDYRNTLFPLKTTQLLVERFPAELRAYYNSNSFRPQVRCSAAKRGLHLRRTVKLDPPSELFIYDLVFRNRKLFRGDHTEGRKSFGFRFHQGAAVNSKSSYTSFRKEVAEAKAKYKFAMKFDISSYFNSLYHHDLVSRFTDVGASQQDVEAYGKFLREINSGRSLDCLPHGLHPCKVLGSDFLSYIDNSLRLLCPILLRFMDDFYLFSDNEQHLYSDFTVIQEMLSDKGLYLNESKTAFGADFGKSITDEVDAVKAELLQRRRDVSEPSGISFQELFLDEPEIDEDSVSDDEILEAIEKLGAVHVDTDLSALSKEQVEYLLTLLHDPSIDESDAELVLVLLRDHGEDVIEKMGEFLIKFPGLAKAIYEYCPSILDKTEFCGMIVNFLRGDHLVTEYQLFWVTKILEDYLSTAKCYGPALQLLHNHRSSTPITRAKLLEIPEHRFGLPDLREQILRSGSSDWPAWAAAIGCRREAAAKRNHLLGYYRNASKINELIADCAIQL